ncbi:MAG: T9SS type A sorting domain-containing protein [Melioribacteraceae bacterium]|nr:T9SS type A sorting domain-containing protein [Saprospiraceae bacterium]MCF8356941.1 T9SS type A sorting domain-containing protein [Melioribacteraceae bacterium]
MKKFSFIAIAIIFIITLLFSDTSITRGPDIGEIYYIGPTVTQNEAIYYSTDFGETATCMDSISEVESICADLTPGSLFRLRMPDCLYFSNNYGQHGSWVFRTAEGDYEIESGRNEGEIFKGPGMSSNDYGFSFTQHALNGCLCSIKEFEIGNQDSIGYILGDIYGITDSLFLLISYDNFESLELQYVFDWHWSHKLSLSRGSEMGELFLYKKTIYGEEKELFYSNDYGQTWVLKNNFNCPNLPISGIVGGRQPGELFMCIEYIQLMSQIKHIFIYHSLDYGETFNIYHPFSYGDDPIYANFEATTTEGTAPLTVQFTDLSNGNVASIWEWDFNNDGTIDSYDQNPEYTYQDTGYYSVNLSVHPLSFHPAIRYNYIHVTENNSSNEEQVQISKTQISNYPNPFNPSTIIRYQLPYNIDNPNIEIYNLKGQLVDEIAINYQQTSVAWHAGDFSSGIYFYKLNIKNSPTQKMLLLK